MKDRMSRREFLKWGGTLGAWAALAGMPKWAWAASRLASSGAKTLVVLFQRGAADGLNMIVPFDDFQYRRARPTIGIKPPGRPDGALDLDGRFGLHPALGSLMPLWKSGMFAAVHAAGSLDGTRSHFEAQDNMETGTPGIETTPDGWLNRCLAGNVGDSPVAAVAISSRLPRILRGDFPVVSFPRMGAYRFLGGGAEAVSFDGMYAGAIDRLLSGAGREARGSVEVIRRISAQAPRSPEDAGFPKGALGRSFFEMGKLIKARVGLRVGFIDVGGWDHHFNEGSVDGLLAARLGELGASIQAFFGSLGNMANDTLLVTMTEFGRTLRENGNRGTDHGHASVMMLFGGKVRGGNVYGVWPGLEPDRLFEGRDLQVTTDFRQVQAEILRCHLGLGDLDRVFPGFRPAKNLGFLG